MKISKFILALLFLPAIALAQSDEEKIQNIVEEGVILNDKGKYEEAISKYEEALDIDKKSSLALYEIAYTYYIMEDYKSAVKYAKKATKSEDRHAASAYLIMGNAYDKLGDVKKSIKAYDEGIDQNPDNHLMYYNKALTCYRAGKREVSEEALYRAIDANAAHPTSHMLLGLIKGDQGKKTQAILATYFFLFLEPSSQRSSKSLDYVNYLLNEGVSKEGNEITINVNSLDDSNPFSTTDMMIQMNSALDLSEKGEDSLTLELNDAQQFALKNQTIFNSLAGIEADQKTDGVWFDLYVPFFTNMQEAELAEVFSYYIQISSGSEDVNDWLDRNESKMVDFQEWIEYFFGGSNE